MGRKKKLLTAEQIGELEKLAGYGLDQESIADFFNISDRTLRNRIKEDPVIYTAYKKGKAAAYSNAAEKLQEAINSGNLTAIIFYLKTQARWCETNRHEITGKEGQPIETKNESGTDWSKVSDETLRALIELWKKAEKEAAGDQGTGSKQ